MDKTVHLDTYVEQYSKLAEIIGTVNQRLISDEPDELIEDNVNFFTKSFLVVMCAYLESYIKDALMVIVEDINQKLDVIKVPHNLIKWTANTSKDLKEDDNRVEHFKISLTREELDNYISGNPHRTKKTFNNFGISLDGNQIFSSHFDTIMTIVNKRNRVVHHNDDASDITNQDLNNYIEALKSYIENLDRIICTHIS